jgi:DNA-binding NarL/FixJ family response regulator
MNFDHQINRVLIADPQFLIVEALKSIFKEDEKYSFAGVVNTKNELEKMLEGMHDGILITDITSFDFDGLNEFINLTQKFPSIRVLILTNAISKTSLIELTKAGFKNIIYKTVDREELFAALESTVKGRKYYSSELLDLMLGMNLGKQSLEESKTLTSSEIEIVRLISQGLTTKEIAVRKNISFHTVNTHRKNTFRKMGVSNTSELIMYAIKSGWIDNIEYYI